MIIYYELNYRELYCEGKGDPAGFNNILIMKSQDINIIKRFVKNNKLKLVDKKDDYANGFVIDKIEVETEYIRDAKENLKEFYRAKQEMKECCKYKGSWGESVNRHYCDAEFRDDPWYKEHIIEHKREIDKIKEERKNWVRIG